MQYGTELKRWYTTGVGSNCILGFTGMNSAPLPSSTSRKIPPTQGTKLIRSNPIKMNHSDFFIDEFNDIDINIYLLLIRVLVY